MSMKKRHQQGVAAAAVEEQENAIRQVFKEQIIADEIGQNQAEKLFSNRSRGRWIPVRRQASQIHATKVGAL